MGADKTFNSRQEKARKASIVDVVMIMIILLWLQCGECDLVIVMLNYRVVPRGPLLILCRRVLVWLRDVSIMRSLDWIYITS